MDFRRFLQTIRRYKILVVLMALVGLGIGVAFTVLRPPLLSTQALIQLPPTRYIQTQVIIADSNPVLTSALPSVQPPVTLAQLRTRVQVSNPSPTVLEINAKGVTAAQAESIANAVGVSYLHEISLPRNPNGAILGRFLSKATIASGAALRDRVLAGVLGFLVGALCGAIIGLTRSSSDKRLRRRDEIADAIGIPVLASIPARHPTDSAGWAKLLDSYVPDVVHAWSLRKALRHLGLTDFRGASGAGNSLTVFSLSTDRGALALGPQLAVFAASLGIPTALVVSAGQDATATATLCAACAVTSGAPGRRFNMRVSVAGEDGNDRLPSAALTIVVAVVDSRAPHVAGTIRTSTAVLGVTAGGATAQQLARVAVSAASDGREIAGILVANPDPTDLTTGRLPQSIRPSHRRQPTRLTGTSETVQ
jgi:capsular polysaccharide biosynthesis protein